MTNAVRTTAEGLSGYTLSFITVTSAQETLGICVGCLTSIYLIIRIILSLKNKK